MSSSAELKTAVFSFEGASLLFVEQSSSLAAMYGLIADLLYNVKSGIVY